jgi:hypothetical protein
MVGSDTEVASGAIVDISIDYAPSAVNKYEIEYNTVDANGASVPNYFSAKDLKSATWKSPEKEGKYKLTSIIRDTNGVESQKSIYITVLNNRCENTYTCITLTDDSFCSADMLFQFPFQGENYQTIYIGTNGYVTFDQGYRHYASYIDQIPHGLIPEGNKDWFTAITVTKCTKNTTINWTGHHYGNSSNTVNFTLILNNDGTTDPVVYSR